MKYNKFFEVQTIETSVVYSRLLIYSESTEYDLCLVHTCG